MKIKHKYLPIIKSKRGELRGVKQLLSRDWDRMTPLLEMLPPENDGYMGNTLKYLEGAIPTNATVMMDFHHPVSPSKVKALITTLESKQRNIIPVFCLDDGAKPVPHFATVSKDEFAFRVRLHQIDQLIGQRINRFLDINGLDAQAGHLIMDLEFIDPNSVGALTVTVPAVVALLPYLEFWKTVTIAGTGLARTLDIQANKISLLSRSEIVLWKSIEGVLRPLVKRLDFGDYCVTNPELVAYNPVVMTVSPKILYTTKTDQWIALKGTSTKVNGWGQTKAMCMVISKHLLFLGGAYSWGSDQIDKCARGTGSPGNSESWKAVATNHHITVVGDLASTLP